MHNMNTFKVLILWFVFTYLLNIGRNNFFNIKTENFATKNEKLNWTPGLMR